MKTILVPIDFSALSRSTAHFGLELAHSLRARVVLLHVVQPSPPVPAFNIPVVELSVWNDSLHRQMTEAMQHFQEEISGYQHLHGHDAVSVSARLVVGQPADSILEVANDEHASFIILGTVGASNAWEKLVGSVTTAVLQRATCPVWVLPNATKLSLLRQFAYFADLEGNELSCINRVMNLGERLGATVEVVHVSPGNDDESMVTEAIVESFEDTFSPDRITFRHVTFESVAQGIDGYVRRHWPDAIVLAHRDRSFLQNLFHNSVIRELALTTKRPLLVVPKNG